MTPERAFFWKIGDIWVFYLVAGLATVLFFIGVAAHIFVWLKSTPKGKIAFSREAFKQTILDTFSGRRIFLGDLPAGIMHLLILLGFVILFIGTSLLAMHEYVYPFLTGNRYLLFEASMEIGGFLLLAGIIWALVRRYIQRIPRLERRLEDLVVPIWLLVLLSSGFILEGLRLASQQPPWGQWSFAGSWIARLVSNSTAESAYPYLWWESRPVESGIHCHHPLHQAVSHVGSACRLLPSSFFRRIQRNISTFAGTR